MTVSPPPDEQLGTGLPERVRHIRDAALECFAAHGTAATSLRQVAQAAGVSIGMVQHHFGTKAGLIHAVDDHVLAVLTASMSSTTVSADPVGDIGHQVTRLIAEHTAVVDYIVRALGDESEIGRVVFDALAAMGRQRWDRLAAQELTRADLDRTWAALNPLLLALGAVNLRTHLNRHLPEQFTTATQLARWEEAVNTLIRHGQLRNQLPQSP